MNIRDAISLVVAEQSLEQDQAAAVMEEIMNGDATPAQISAFITALRMKGENDAEIAGMAQVMRSKAATVPFAGRW